MADQAWGVVIHGGAGLDKGMILPYDSQIYLDTMLLAVQAARELILKGGSAVDAAVAAVMVLEDSEVFNAGRGSVLNRAGRVEMDACVMDGTRGKCGSCTGVRTVKNPVLVAKAIMTETAHCFLAGSAGDELAASKGIEIVDPEYFITAARKEQLATVQGVNPTLVTLDHSNVASSLEDSVDNEKVIETKGTVGAVVLDLHGRVACAASTGGLCNKVEGRVGAIPCIGAGSYANQRVAVTCTGTGEAFLRRAVAAEVGFRVSLMGMGVEQAVDSALGGMNVDDGGMIAIDVTGTPVMKFNTGGMFRAAHTSTMTAPEAYIW